MLGRTGRSPEPAIGALFWGHAEAAYGSSDGKSGKESSFRPLPSAYVSITAVPRMHPSSETERVLSQFSPEWFTRTDGGYHGRARHSDIA